MKCPECGKEITTVECIGNAYYTMTGRLLNEQNFPKYTFHEEDDNSIHTYQCPECFEELTYSQAMEVIGVEVNSRNNDIFVWADLITENKEE